MEERWSVVCACEAYGSIGGRGRRQGASSLAGLDQAYACTVTSYVCSSARIEICVFTERL